ncbi:MarR family transcriptional regulator [Bradyrhizobium manausense]|uniref:MarR family winged helix-turn-helix transcriptional regulator n=1 Tax=Bradyrhizobium TaxID=374 RepID=UPI001BA965E2|nr:MULTISPECIES: MarR family transcriptional regulator [Bradyrhizobium]MBR0827896.1 MarR family transcriptional regulator [Bradyrhizobium manausense]UVO32770.1 MarR family transcriptional regulator [Bradyrhizobium arachidis]
MTRSPQPKDQLKGRKLSNYLCFAIYSANLAFGRAYKPILDAVGLTYTQYIALVALAEADEQTVSELGDKLFLESNTLTPILKKLEQMGYLRRQRDPEDERQVRVSLTPAGRCLLDKDLGAPLVEATGLGDDFPVVQKTVSRLRDNLLRAGEAQPAKKK